jgi:hypothetical protein
VTAGGFRLTVEFKKKIFLLFPGPQKTRYTRSFFISQKSFGKMMVVQ